jgi:membrane-bound lytic murein transglycosylase F
MMIQNLLMLLLAFFSFTVIGSIEVKSIETPHFEISKFEAQKFFEHTQSRLPQWLKSFQKYAKKYDVPWTLIAAVAYQESKWDHQAVSHTGVKGLMQITRSTAEYIGISDREDPMQSIQGGAYYLKYLYSKTPGNLSNHERWAQALAAYNMGWAHVRDARRLAVEFRYNPNRWKELRLIIPKLEKEKYYSRLTFGYARGRETVEFVDNTIGYYKMLNKIFTQPLLTSRDF